MLKPNKYDLIAPKPTKTDGDRWRPMETDGDRWRPMETDGDRWRPMETDGDRKYAYAKIYFRSGEHAQPFFSATWRFNEAARSLVFFCHDPKSKHLRLHTIRSFAR